MKSLKHASLAIAAAIVLWGCEPNQQSQVLCFEERIKSSVDERLSEKSNWEEDLYADDNTPNCKTKE